LFLNKNNQYAVECYTQVSNDCLKNGEYCDSEEDAEYWVEEECWIFSGEGWFCNNCNRHFMQNLTRVRRDKGQEPPPDDDLYKGIETIL
jgi:hypothetical protein